MTNAYIGAVCCLQFGHFFHPVFYLLCSIIIGSTFTMYAPSIDWRPRGQASLSISSVRQPIRLTLQVDEPIYERANLSNPFINNGYLNPVSLDKLFQLSQTCWKYFYVGCFYCTCALNHIYLVPFRPLNCMDWSQISLRRIAYLRTWLALFLCRDLLHLNIHGSQELTISAIPEDYLDQGRRPNNFSYMLSDR